MKEAPRDFDQSKHADRVRLTSSLVNADVRRLLGLVIEDVRITRDLEPTVATAAVHNASANNGNIKTVEQVSSDFFTGYGY